MSIRTESRVVDIVEAVLDQFPEDAARPAQRATIARARERIALVETIRRNAIANASLPADLADVDAENRARLDDFAARYRITPTAALALARSGQRAAQSARA